MITFNGTLSKICTLLCCVKYLYLPLDYNCVLVVNLDVHLRSYAGDRERYGIISYTSRSPAVGRKAFRYAAPTVWNFIPFNIRHSPSIGSFKRHLKTYLFTLPG